MEKRILCVPCFIREIPDRGGSDRRENDEGGTTARWHEKVAARIGEGLRRGDSKRQTTKG